MTLPPEPFQPNATVNVYRDGDIVSIVHMTRLGSRHVILLSPESARMLADELLAVLRPREPEISADQIQPQP